MMQSDNNVLSAYDMTDLMFKSIFSKLTILTIEFATNHWMKQISLRRCLCIIKHIKLDKKAHNQTCDICDGKVLSFTENSFTNNINLSNFIQCRSSNKTEFFRVTNR